MGPKSKKKSKAELEEEKLQREEEERKAKIAEDKRQAEEKEKKRQEMAKLAAEQKALREKELQRWNEQYAEISDEIKSNEQQLQAEERQEVCICRKYFCFVFTYMLYQQGMELLLLLWLLSI